MVSFWDLMTGVCFAMPIGGALAAEEGKGASEHAEAIIIGLAVGCLWAWTMRAVGVNFVRSGARSNGQFRALYFGAMVWMFAGLFLGSWVTSVAESWIHGL